MKNQWVSFIFTISVCATISADTIRFTENEKFGYVFFSDSIYFNNDKVYIVKFDEAQHETILDSLNCFLLPQLADLNIVSFIYYAEDSSRLITLMLSPKLKYDTILVYSQAAQYSYYHPIVDVYCLRDYKYIAKDSMLFWKSTGGSSRNVLEIGKINEKKQYERLNSYLEISSYSTSNDFNRIFLIQYSIGMQYNNTNGPLTFISYFDLSFLQKIEFLNLDVIGTTIRSKKIGIPIYFIGKEYSTENQNLFKFVNDSVMQLTYKSYPEIVRDFYLFKDSISYTTAFTFYRCCDADTGIQKHIIIE